MSLGIRIEFHVDRLEAAGVADVNCRNGLGIHGAPYWLINDWLFD
jgi:hypothetical protein